MKKLIALSMALILLMGSVAMFASCSGQEKVLIVGFDAEYPPYGYLDVEKNTYVGFDLEYAKLVCDKIGYELVLKPIDWNIKDSLMEAGEINCIWNGFTINGREDEYTWSVPYVDNTIVVLTKSDLAITKLSDLAGKIVSAQADSSGESALKDKTDLVASLDQGKYLTCKDYVTGFNELNAGSIHALVIDESVAKYLVGDKEGYTILDEVLKSEQYGVGFKKGNTELRDLVQNAMIEIAGEGDTVTKLAEKYGISPEVLLIGKE